MTEQESEAPWKADPPAHRCYDHSTYTFGKLGWGWYCEVCGSFAPMDETPED